jgi:hypothetical protein
MSNPPGMDYLVRVGNLWNNLLIKQSSEMQKAWSQIKGGTYQYQNAYSVWATAVEDYYGFAVDASRGPGYIPRPAWLYFAYSPKEQPTLSYTARLDRSESPATTLDKTDFASLDKGPDSRYLLAGPLYEQCHVNGDQLEIVLDAKELANLAATAKKNKQSLNGQYISFVFGQNRGPEPPLVIVVLSISDCP